MIARQWLSTRIALLVLLAALLFATVAAVAYNAPAGNASAAHGLIAGSNASTQGRLAWSS